MCKLIAICKICFTKVKLLPPDSIDYCPHCERIVETYTKDVTIDEYEKLNDFEVHEDTGNSVTICQYCGCTNDSNPCEACYDFGCNQGIW